jgi:hypothetical protein
VGTDRSATLKRTLTKLALLALAGVALYALAGFLLAPRLIEHKLEAMVGQETGLTLAIEATAVNPFNLTLSLNNVTLFRPENTPVASIDRIDARLRAASLVERAWLLHDVVIQRPRVSLKPADGDAEGDSARAVSVSPSPGAQPRIAVSLDDALLLQPYADLGHGFSWSAERLTTGARIEYRRGLAHIDADLAIRALVVADTQTNESVLRVPSIVGRGIVLATPPATLSVQVVRLEGPQLTLKRDSSGEFHLPPGFATLLSGAAAGHDTGGRFELSGGRVDFTDLKPPAPVRLGFDGIGGTIAGRRAGRDTAAAVSLRGRVSDTGAGVIAAEWLLSRPRARTRLALDLERVELPEISPYVAGMIGRYPLAGRMDLTVRLRLDEGAVALDNQIAVSGLQFGERVENGIGDLPLDRAVALLEDHEGRMVMRIPVAPSRLGADAGAADAFSLALSEYTNDLVAAPFEYLAELVGSPHPSIGKLEFPPGSAEIHDDTRAKLDSLDRALELRPRLGFIVYPGLDPMADREALARQQIRLHVNLATSARRPDEAAENRIDFDDPKVQTVLDEFAENRLSQARQAAIADRFPDRNASRYRAVFEALVDNEEVPRSALDRLARYRARSIIEELVSSGSDRSRLQQAEAILLTGPDEEPGGIVRIGIRHLDRSTATAIKRTQGTQGSIPAACSASASGRSCDS